MCHRTVLHGLFGGSELLNVHRFEKKADKGHISANDRTCKMCQTTFLDKTTYLNKIMRKFVSYHYKTNLFFLKSSIDFVLLCDHHGHG